MHTPSNKKLNDILKKYTYAKKLDKTISSPNKINTHLLHMASCYGDNKLLNKLINLGVDINLPNDSGNSPLYVAIAHGNDECALTLIENGTSVHATFDDQISPLCSAAKYGNIEIMQLLINEGANVDDTCLDGATALLLAVEAGNIEMVQFLLDKGANINLGNPILWACMWGHSEIVKALLLKNANYKKVFSGPVKDIKTLFEKHNQEIQSRMQAHIKNLQDSQLIKLTLKDIAHIMGNHDIVSILQQFEDANSIFSLVLQYPLATTGLVAIAAISIIATCSTILTLSIPTIIAASTCSAVLIGTIGIFSYQNNVAVNIEEPNKPIETAATCHRSA